jgi:hypothetical protein
VALVDRGIAEPRRRDDAVFIEAVDGWRPRVVADAGAAVAVFGVSGVEPKIEGKRPVLRLCLEKLDTAIGHEIGLVARGAVGLRFEIRIAADGLVAVELGGRDRIRAGPSGAICRNDRCGNRRRGAARGKSC